VDGAAGTRPLPRPAAGGAAGAPEGGRWIGENVYAVHETLDFDDQPGGGITAYARDPGTGELTALNARATLGDSPCHVTLDRSGRFVLNANYGVDAGSVTVHRIEPDGRLGEMTDHVEHIASGATARPGHPTARPPPRDGQGCQAWARQLNQANSRQAPVDGSQRARAAGPARTAVEMD
jgi:hypothetical protein